MHSVSQKFRDNKQNVQVNNEKKKIDNIDGLEKKDIYTVYNNLYTKSTIKIDLKHF